MESTVRYREDFAGLYVRAAHHAAAGISEEKVGSVTWITLGAVAAD
jgi:hypothetical protein